MTVLVPQACQYYRFVSEDVSGHSNGLFGIGPQDPARRGALDVINLVPFAVFR